MLKAAPSSRLRASVALLMLGLALNLFASPETEAARVKVGPLEIETDPVPAQPVEQAAAEGEDKGEDKAEPYAAQSASPKEFPLVPEHKRLVYHAQLHDVVDRGVGPFLERVLADAEEQQAAAVIIEIDTPGGRVDAAVEIKDALLRSKVPTIAWVNKQAISAGALIAYAHDYIIWSDGATMGAATPIQLGGGGEAQPVEEKMVSYMRGVMRATAEANGRDGDVAEAMVDAELEIPGFAPKGKLLTASLNQAAALGLKDGEASTFDEVLVVAGLEGAHVVRPTINWAEKTARFLTHPVVSSVLMSIGMLGILIEFYTPGIGFAGILGALSLFLFFAGHLAVNLAGWEEVIVFFIGVGLLVAEIFVIPGFGIAGILGALFIAISLILALVGLDLHVAWDTGLLMYAFLNFAAALVVTAVGFALSVRFLPSFGPVSRLVLKDTLKEASSSGEGTAAERNELPGQTGVALTDLRPGGRARIGDRKLDVSAYNDFIERGQRLRVVKVNGPQVMVERLPADETEEPDVD